ncbi:unnamed protein product [Rhodiola kirilowii]
MNVKDSEAHHGLRRYKEHYSLQHIYMVLDYAQTGLIIAAVFFFFLRWRNGWYQSAEQRMSAPTVYPPPPPPPPPKVAKEGIPLPPHLIEQFVLYALRSVQILQ